MQFEKKYNLLELTVDGFRYWAYIRWNVQKLCNENVGEINTDGENRKIHNLKQFFCIIKNLSIGNPLVMVPKKDILLISHPRRVLSDRKYKCIYTDDIADIFSKNSITGEFIYGMGHYLPSYTNNLCFLDVVDLIPPLFYKLYKFIYKKQLNELEKSIKEIINNLSKETDNILDIKSITSMTIRRFIWYKQKYKILKKIIEKISPKVILEVVGYETNKMIINEISSEFGITTIELQHGPIGVGKIPYNYLVEKKYNYMPDKLFVFSDYWKNTCSFPIGKNNIISTGFPYLDSQMNLYPKKTKTDGVLNIIILSQPAISAQLQDFVLKSAEKILYEKLPVTIIYKLHPNEYSKANESKTIFSNYNFIKIIDNSSVSLYKLFSESDIQVGVFSTAIYEGLSYELETWIYMVDSINVESYMGDLFKYNYASKIKTVDDFIERIKKYRSCDTKESVKSPFFVRNALENIAKEIEKCLF